MKKLLLFFIIFHGSFFVGAQGTWIPIGGFPAPGRECPSGFAIGNKGYVFGGRNSTYYMNDFWEYDAVAGTWTQKASLPADARYAAVGFAINNLGYIGTGYNWLGQRLNDFWEYNPATDQWTRKTDFPGLARYFASAFVIGNYGYITCGGVVSGLTMNDLWQWNQATDTWTQKANLTGPPRMQAAGFSINDKGYVTTGSYDGTENSYLRDLWEYDTLANAWSHKADVPGPPCVDATAFSLCGKGYMGTGGDFPLLNDFYEYDPALNQWTMKAVVPGPNNDDGISFSIGDKGYLGMTDLEPILFQYTPDNPNCATDVNEVMNNTTLKLFPNPTNETFTVSAWGLDVGVMEIFNTMGKNVYKTSLNEKKHTLNPKLVPGIYFVKVTDGEKLYTEKLVVN